MLALLEHWSRTTDTFPGVSTLARFSSLSERSVKAALAGLETQGYIRVLRTKGRANRYDFSPLFNKARSSAPVALPPVQHLHRSSSAGVAPVPKRVVQELPQGSAPVAPAVVHQLPPKRSIEEIQLRDTTNTPQRSTVLKQHFLALYKDLRGGEPDWKSQDHAKYGKAFKELAETFNGNLEAQKQVINTAMGDEFSPCMDPLLIVKRRNEYFGRPPRRKVSGPTISTPQHGLAERVQVNTDLSDLGGAE